MSRKMIDYQVENGKISTIDGYKVGGNNNKRIKLTYTPQFLDYENYQQGATVEVGKSFKTVRQYMSENELPMVNSKSSITHTNGTATFIETVGIDEEGYQYGVSICIKAGKLADGIKPRMEVYKVKATLVDDNNN